MIATMFSHLEASLDHAVRLRIASQPDACAFSLSAYAHAEGASEGTFFERALQRVTEPRLHAIIAKHQADEVRHEHMLHERREALGLTRHEIPERLQWVGRLSDACGGVLDQTMDSDEKVARVYALLYLVEERALWEFDRVARSFRETGDQITADMLDAIGKDEERHLRFCETIGTRMASSPEAFDAMLEEMRPIECRIYGEQSRAYCRYLLDEGFLSLGVLTVPVRGLVALGNTLALSAPSPAQGNTPHGHDARSQPPRRHPQPLTADRSTATG